MPVEKGEWNSMELRALIGRASLGIPLTASSDPSHSPATPRVLEDSDIERRHRPSRIQISPRANDRIQIESSTRTRGKYFKASGSRLQQKRRICVLKATDADVIHMYSTFSFSPPSKKFELYVDLRGVIYRVSPTSTHCVISLSQVLCISQCLRDSRGEVRTVAMHMAYR
jgi:hypothetical protein